MTVTILLFARAKELAGRPELRMEVASPVAAAELMDAALAAEPSLRPLAPYLRIAVNRELVDGHRVVREGDEVAFLPPMSGG